jgi:hypothetical protein
MKAGAGSGVRTSATLETSATLARPRLAVRTTGRLRGLIDEFPAGLRGVAVALATAIAFFGLMGTVYYATYAPALDAFDVNGEIAHGFDAPALFSGGLLFAASLVALGEWRSGALPRWAWLGIAAFFAFMGIDELATIHEHVESWVGIDWQLLYLPLAAIGAVFWLALLRRFSLAPVAKLFWVGGVVAWLIAQVIEHVEFDNHGHAIASGPALIICEEIWEMIGSSLFLLALLVFARWRAEG